MFKISTQLKRRLLTFTSILLTSSSTFFIPLFSQEVVAPQTVVVDEAPSTIPSNKPIIASSTPRAPLIITAPAQAPVQAPAPARK